MDGPLTKTKSRLGRRSRSRVRQLAFVWKDTDIILSCIDCIPVAVCRQYIKRRYNTIQLSLAYLVYNLPNCSRGIFRDQTLYIRGPYMQTYLPSVGLYMSFLQRIVSFTRLQ